MEVIKTLANIFDVSLTIILVINAFVSSTGVFQNEEKIEADADKDGVKWHQRVRMLILIATIVVYIVFLIALHKYGASWLVFVFALPVYLEYLTGAYRSFRVVGDVIRINGSKAKLSIRELSAINILAYVLWLFDVFWGPEKIMGFAIECQNVIISDLLTMICHILICFIYIFFICSVLATPIIKGVEFLRKTCSKTVNKEKIKEFEDFLEKSRGGKIKEGSYLIEYIENLADKNFFVKVLSGVFVPIIFTIDVLLLLVNIGLSIVLSVMKNVIILLRLMKDTFMRMLDWISNLSDKRIVAVSFRLALIIALVITVGFNRYITIFRNYEASTAILEFVASSIIIPIIFEWINRFNCNKD